MKDIPDPEPRAKVEGLSELRPNIAEAIRSQRLIRPEGPWVLTAIRSKKEPTKTATFRPGEEDRMGAWIQRYNLDERHHIYFMLNTPTRDLDSKASKADVLEMIGGHVDVDPSKPSDTKTDAEKAEHYEREREAAAAKLRDFDPAPSLTIDSGGGVQGVWLFDEPLFIGGNIPAAEDAELYNQQFIADLDGDASCFNLDRVLRLPGTINWKEGDGRKPRLARLVHPAEGEAPTVYSMAEFTAAPTRNASPTAGQGKVQLKGVPPPLASLDELPAEVTPRIRMLIVQGCDPDEPDKYASRSEVTFAVVCGMVRGGCTDEQIGAVLLDPDMGISAHTREQKRPLEYAARQIERARAEVEEPMLARLNADHAVIELYGGKTKVVSWEPSEVDPSRKEIVAQSFEDFRNRYMNRRVQTGQTKEGNPIYSPAGKWWLEHPMRRQYPALLFRPNEHVDEETALNIWQGLAVKPAPGDWSLLRRLIVEGLAGGDESLADYVIRWTAYGVQHPERPAEVALTLIGGKGTGKSTFGRIVTRLYGQHGVAVAGAKSLTNNFNKHLHGCCALFADEAVPPGNREAAGLIKSFITDGTIMIEPKGVDAFEAPNRLKVIIASNDPHVVDASDDERRYAVLNVSSRFAAQPGAGRDDERVQFWRDLNRQMETGGVEAFLHDLLALDLGDWHPRYDVPQTSALSEQKVASLKGFDRIWFDALASGDLPPLTGLRKNGDCFVLPARQLAEYSSKSSRRTVTANWVGNVLGPGQPDKDGVIHRPGMGFEKWERGGPKGWVIPPLPQARQAWNARRFRFQWDGATCWGYESVVIDDRDRDDARPASPRDDEPY